jgi:uncharacterized protein
MSKKALGHSRIAASISPGRRASSMAPVLESIDARTEYGEIRIQAIGAAGEDILFVVYTDRDQVRRIISARQADKRERELWLSFASR